MVWAEVVGRWLVVPGISEAKRIFQSRSLLGWDSLNRPPPPLARCAARSDEAGAQKRGVRERHGRGGCLSVAEVLLTWDGVVPGPRQTCRQAGGTTTTVRTAERGLGSSGALFFLVFPVYGPLPLAR